MKTISGQLSAEGRKIGVVASRFNSFVTDKLMDGALDVLLRLGAKKEDITVVMVPGAFEIPLAAKALIDSHKVDGVLCLGAVIRGDTPHFDYVCAEVSKGVASVMMQTGVPVSFGVLTTNNVQQAIERAGLKSGNKGAECAMALVETISVIEQTKKVK